MYCDALAQLKNTYLLKFYTTFVRPGLEYAAPAWHPGLTQQLSHSIERVQSSALHIIYPELTYCQALSRTGLPTLHSRREQLCCVLLNRSTVASGSNTGSHHNAYHFTIITSGANHPSQYPDSSRTELLTAQYTTWQDF